VPNFTLICPFYRQVGMLEQQIAEWNRYPLGIDFIIVDDGSPEPAKDVVLKHAAFDTLDRLKLLRVTEDIPWNRSTARNLGTHMADTDWILHVDTDHVLPWQPATRLLNFQPESGAWYRFPRWRIGTADDTRKKDAIPDDSPCGKIHPHIDSHLMQKGTYASVGGYDTRYAGCLGGGTVFLRALQARAKPKLLPDDIWLEVYTRSVVPDSSISTLDRSHTEFRRRQKLIAAGKIPPRDPVPYAWERVL
jgi:hypothetical protein